MNTLSSRERAILEILTSHTDNNALVVESRNKRLLGISEAARYLDIATGTLYNMVSRGQISVVRIGRSIKFDIRELDDYIAQHTQQKRFHLPLDMSA